MAARHRQMTPAKMVLTNYDPERIRLERRYWRELAETRLPATTHHKLTKTATWPAPWEELKTEWFKAKCKKEHPDTFRKAVGEKAVEEARELDVKEKNIGWEIWTDESVNEKENRHRAPEEEEENIPSRGGSTE